MGALSILRVARRFTGLNKSEYAHLETLIEEEAVKIKDGYHHARWICAASGALFAFGCFMPLALTVHPLFWIGTAGMCLIGGTLGYIFHRLAKQISPPQMRLRQRCMKLGHRLISFKNLMGAAPILSPKVAEFLDEAAATYLLARPHSERDRKGALLEAWDDATARAQRGMDEAMAQMLALAEPESPQAQEAELARGWAKPLLEEMKATAQALAHSARSASFAAQMDPASAPLATLKDARADLERLDSAVSELEQDIQA